MNQGPGARSAALVDVSTVLVVKGDGMRLSFAMRARHQSGHCDHDRAEARHTLPAIPKAVAPISLARELTLLGPEQQQR